MLPNPRALPPGPTVKAPRIRGWHGEVILRDATVAHFIYRFLVDADGGPREQQLSVPVSFDRHNGRQRWEDVIPPASILTCEPRPRPVAFIPLGHDPNPGRNQVGGHFCPQFLFYADADRDDLAFGFDTLDVFRNMQADCECVYVDIFAAMEFVTLRIRGDGFDVRPRAERAESAETPYPRCSAEDRPDGWFGTDRMVELPAETRRATDGGDGSLTVETSAAGFAEVVWTLKNPRLNTRYKVYFLANPAERRPAGGRLSPGVAAQRAELYRLVEEYNRGNLDRYLGEFLIAADGQVLDHGADLGALRPRARELATRKAIPHDHLVEYYVPTVD